MMTDEERLLGWVKELKEGGESLMISVSFFKGIYLPLDRLYDVTDREVLDQFCLENGLSCELLDGNICLRRMNI